jgi:hypothetical protein
MMTRRYNLADILEGKKEVKKKEIADFILQNLGLDFYEAWSGSDDPVKLISLVEAYRVRLYCDVLKKIMLEESSNSKNLSSLKEVMNAFDEIDKKVEALYSELHLIVPIKKHLEELGLR